MARLFLGSAHSGRDPGRANQPSHRKNILNREGKGAVDVLYTPNIYRCVVATYLISGHMRSKCDHRMSINLNPA